MNRGKLLQIFDNLLINSEYWLEQDQRLGRVDDGVVTITIDAPTVTIKDNGRGIDRQVESSLFQPFVTRKPRGEGRGLGLFILRQLLEAEGCEIDLGAVRNKGGRLYEFVVDFTGAQVDE
jgi:signal transduction histidine kinase